jgi:hypothetical protein
MLHLQLLLVCHRLLLLLLPVWLELLDLTAALPATWAAAAELPFVAAAWRTARNPTSQSCDRLADQTLLLWPQAAAVLQTQPTAPAVFAAAATASQQLAVAAPAAAPQQQPAAQLAVYGTLAGCPAAALGLSWHLAAVDCWPLLLLLGHQLCLLLLLLLQHCQAGQH